MRILLDDSLAKPQTIRLFKEAFPKTYIGVLDGGDRECRLAKYFADYVYDFKWDDSETYIMKLEEFLNNNDWDVFVPRRFLPDIPQEIGKTKIMIDNQSAVSAADNKCETYRLLEKTPEFQSLIPYYIDGAEQKIDINIVRKILNRNVDIMIKKKVDIGGDSYKKITDIERYQLTEAYTQMSYEQIKYICDGEDVSYMIGEVLTGNMISVDVFSDVFDNIYTVKRLKIDDLRILYEGEDLNGICEQLYTYFGFKYAVNMQFMRSSINGQLKLLEINPRISGGIHMASKLMEVNIPKVLLSKLIGIPDKEEIDFSFKHKIVADVPQITVLL